MCHSSRRSHRAARGGHEALPTADALRRIAAAWTSVGAYLSTPPADGPVDLEGLIVDTACVAPDGERLAVLAAALTDTEGSAEASAALGALLSWADELSGGTAEALRAATARCRPISPPRPFFRVVREMPLVAESVRRDALPRFAAWGFWHDGDTGKPEAVRPEAWIVAHAPELRIQGR